MTQPLRVVSRVELSSWFKDHREEREVWLIIKKRDSMEIGVGIDEAIEEAIAHGWIDS